MSDLLHKEQLIHHVLVVLAISGLSLASYDVQIRGNKVAGLHNTASSLKKH